MLARLLICLFFTMMINKTQGKYHDNKIFGGRLAKEGEFPFAVVLRGNLGCGGAVLTLKTVLTAGHCFTTWGSSGEPEHLDVNNTYAIGGSVNCAAKQNTCQRRRIISYLLHNKLSRRKDGSLFHDIATAKLQKPFKASDTLKPIKIVSSDPAKFKQAWDDLVASGKTCASMGWGFQAYQNNSSQTSPSSEFLKVIEVVPWENSECVRTAYSPDDNVTKFGEVCATSTKQGEGVCYGDSGSPLFCDGYVYGLTTANVNCHNINLPQYFLLHWYYIDYFGLGIAYSGATTLGLSINRLNCILTNFVLFILYY